MAGITSIFKSFSLDAIVPVLRRFPAPLFWCVVAAILCEAIEFDVLAQDIERWSVGASWALSASLAVTFWADGRDRANRATHLLAMLAGIAFYFAGFYLTKQSVESTVMVSVVLFGLMLIAPFSLRAESNSKLNLWLCHGVTLFIFSVVGAGLFMGGVWAILEAIKALFELNLPVDKILTHLYILTYTLLTPLFFFQHLPRIQELSEDDFKTKHPYWFLLVYVVLPLWVVYLGVLYVYFGKIGLEQALPKNVLAGMITGLTAVGLYIHTSLYLRSESGKLHERLFYRYFYPAMIVPLGVFAYALYLRVSAYGWTDERVYLVTIGAVLAFGIVQYLIVGWRKLSLTAVIASWLVIPALLALPPFYPSEISIKSQIARFESAFAQRKTMPNKDNSEAARLEGRMSSALDYLQKNKAIERLKKTMDAPSQALVGDIKDASGVMKALGFTYISNSNEMLNNKYHSYSQSIYKNALTSDELGVTYAKISFFVLPYGDNKISATADGTMVKITIKEPALEFVFDLSKVAALAETLQQENQNKPVWIAEKDSKFSAQLMIEDMNIQKTGDGKPSINTLNGFVLFKTPQKK